VSRKSIFSVITFGLLAVATTSCGGGEAPKPTESKAPQSAASDTPAASSAVAAPATSFSQPLVAAQEKETDPKSAEATAKPTDAIVAGLLPGSDSDSVVRSTTKGRTDPFSGVVLNTTTETKTTKTTQAAPSITKPVKIASSSTSATKATSTTKVTTIAPKDIPTTITTNLPRKPGSGLGIANAAATLTKKTAEPSKVTPTNKPATTTIAIQPVNTPGISGPAAKPSPEVATRDIPAAVAPPSIAPAPIPQPNLARAIGVSGVSQVNGQTQVIIKLPTESFSRYVSVGERLMDGKVLVKRVQEFSGAAPVVILEEVGIEVPRKIGEKPMVEK
jgi:hypothetical protein